MPLRNQSAAKSRRTLRRLATAAGRVLRRFETDEGGNVAITTAVVLPLLVGGIGMGVTYSMGNSTRSDMQNALDSSVLAGVIASNSGGDPIGTANTVFQSNLSAWAKSNASAINASFNWSNGILTGQATGSASNLFGAVVGTRNYTITVNSAATSASTPLCVLGLDSLGSGAFNADGSALTFNANCAVQANSASSSGMTQKGNASLSAKKFGVTGGSKVSNYQPPPQEGSPAIPDPYASLPFPSYTTCDKNAKMLSIKDTETLSPGTYCGGIHMDSTAQVTLQPGIYVMVDGPFWADGSAKVTGDQVMIAFTGKGSTLDVWGNAQMNVTSPTSGTYMNMQFMQDINSSDTHNLWVSIGGSDSDGGKLTYDGVAYFPTQNFWVRGKATVNINSPTLSIVSSDINIQGAVTVNITNSNPRNLPVTPPVTTYGARLIR
jgi:Flp pilus assembly protein TadG